MKKNLSVLLPAIVAMLFMLSLTGYAHGKHGEFTTIKANIPLDYPLFVSAEDSQANRDSHAETAIQSRRHLHATSAKARVAKRVMLQDEGEIIFCVHCLCDLFFQVNPINGHLFYCNLADCDLHPGKWCGAVIHEE